MYDLEQIQVIFRDIGLSKLIYNNTMLISIDLIEKW